MTIFNFTTVINLDVGTVPNPLCNFETADAQFVKLAIISFPRNKPISMILGLTHLDLK